MVHLVVVVVATAAVAFIAGFLPNVNGGLFVIKGHADFFGENDDGHIQLPGKRLGTHFISLPKSSKWRNFNWDDSWKNFDTGVDNRSENDHEFEDNLKRKLRLKFGLDGSNSQNSGFTSHSEREESRQESEIRRSSSSSGNDILSGAGQANSLGGGALQQTQSLGGSGLDSGRSFMQQSSSSGSDQIRRVTAIPLGQSASIVPGSAGRSTTFLAIDPPTVPAAPVVDIPNTNAPAGPAGPIVDVPSTDIPVPSTNIKVEGQLQGTKIQSQVNSNALNGLALSSGNAGELGSNLRTHIGVETSGDQANGNLNVVNSASENSSRRKTLELRADVRSGLNVNSASDTGLKTGLKSQIVVPVQVSVTKGGSDRGSQSAAASAAAVAYSDDAASAPSSADSIGLNGILGKGLGVGQLTSGVLGGAAGGSPLGPLNLVPQIGLPNAAAVATASAYGGGTTAASATSIATADGSQINVNTGNIGSGAASSATSSSSSSTSNDGVALQVKKKVPIPTHIGISADIQPQGNLLGNLPI